MNSNSQTRANQNRSDIEEVGRFFPDPFHLCGFSLFSLPLFIVIIEKRNVTVKVVTRNTAKSNRRTRPLKCL